MQIQLSQITKIWTSHFFYITHCYTYTVIQLYCTLHLYCYTIIIQTKYFVKQNCTKNERVMCMNYEYHYCVYRVKIIIMIWLEGL